MSAAYVGRFAPSPTGPLHAGSLVAALASWLDARACGGRWLVRIEDVDLPRCREGAAERILAQLAACGMVPDAPPLYQSTRGQRYQQALDELVAKQLAYPCACTRSDIAQALTAQGHTRQRHVELPYPGTCRPGAGNGLGGRPARAWRFNTTIYQSKQPPALIGQAQAASLLIANNGVRWTDRRLSAQWQDVTQHTGDFVLKRADGLWAYQLAVVVDDADQGITDIVRGEDLADNTPRQILLQSALGLPTPRYLHTPLVRAADGEKLSKQHGAPPIDDSRPLEALAAAAHMLGLPPLSTGNASTVSDALMHWSRAWTGLYNPARDPNSLP